MASTLARDDMSVWDRYFLARRSRPTAPQSAVNDIMWIDTNDVCNLKCPTCIRGVRGMPNTGRRLPLDQFQAIVRKAAGEGYKRIGLFNWTEPFLNPRLARYLEAIKENGLITSLSSNFSLRRIPILEEVLRVTDQMTVSVSGFEQSIYEINHVGGSIEYVKENLRRTGELKAAGTISTHVILRLIRFPYNVGEEPKLRALASGLGLDFEVIQGVGDPLHPLSSTPNGAYDAMVAAPKEQQISPPDKVCPLVFGQSVVDSKGDVYLCCAYPNLAALRIGSFVDLSHDQLLLLKHNHAVCKSCNMPRRQASPEDRQLYLDALTGCDEAVTHQAASS
jgi:MoaA/NifB/PqqE/SkfB family radical SAM enzyme